MSSFISIAISGLLTCINRIYDELVLAAVTVTGIFIFNLDSDLRSRQWTLPK